MSVNNLELINAENPNITVKGVIEALLVECSQEQTRQDIDVDSFDTDDFNDSSCDVSLDSKAINQWRSDISDNQTEGRTTKLIQLKMPRPSLRIKKNFTMEHVEKFNELPIFKVQTIICNRDSTLNSSNSDEEPR